MVGGVFGASLLTGVARAHVRRSRPLSDHRGRQSVRVRLPAPHACHIANPTNVRGVCVGGAVSGQKGV